MENSRWRRLTEERAGGAKSVFHFDVQGQAAKSTHSGIPWLRFIRRERGERLHFWLFDGWNIPHGRSFITEVYPALWSRSFARGDRTGDQHDVFSIIATWLCRKPTWRCSFGLPKAFLVTSRGSGGAGWRGLNTGCSRLDPGRWFERRN